MLSLGNICGTKCTLGNCECGNTTFNPYNHLYCCIAKNETCRVDQGMSIQAPLNDTTDIVNDLPKLPYFADGVTTCHNGQAISIHGNFCPECKECPISKESNLALTSNCSKTSNHFCPLFPDSSKICMDKVNVAVDEYCSIGGDYWTCPNAKSGLDFDQCHGT